MLTWRSCLLWRPIIRRLKRIFKQTSKRCRSNFDCKGKDQASVPREEARVILCSIEVSLILSRQRALAKATKTSTLISRLISKHQLTSGKSQFRNLTSRYKEETGNFNQSLMPWISNFKMWRQKGRMRSAWLSQISWTVNHQTMSQSRWSSSSQVKMAMSSPRDSCTQKPKFKWTST